MLLRCFAVPRYARKQQARYQAIYEKLRRLNGPLRGRTAARKLGEVQR